MPLALFALTLSAFAIGTTEFVIVGLLPTIASQLQVTLPSAGLLVSLYALGVAIGAPLLTAVTGKLPRKWLLVGLMALFTLGNLLAWQAPDYGTLILARVLTGLAHGVFFSIGSTIATSLVPKEKAATAIAIQIKWLKGQPSPPGIVQRRGHAAFAAQRDHGRQNRTQVGKELADGFGFFVSIGIPDVGFHENPPIGLPQVAIRRFEA